MVNCWSWAHTHLCHLEATAATMQTSTSIKSQWSLKTKGFAQVLSAAVEVVFIIRPIICSTILCLLPQQQERYILLPPLTTFNDKSLSYITFSNHPSQLPLAVCKMPGIFATILSWRLKFVGICVPRHQTTLMSSHILWQVPSLSFIVGILFSEVKVNCSNSLRMLCSLGRAELIGNNPLLIQ